MPRNHPRPCPVCGKPSSSPDAETFCGPCEVAYHQDEAARAKAAEARRIRRLSRLY